MAVDLLLGLQWGDEGKGKIVDVLTASYDIIARFQGGPNAGHTLEFEGIKHVLHTIPSGIFHPTAINLIGNGVVIDPAIFKKEIEGLTPFNIDIKNKLLISKKAHLILPTHRMLDAASEAAKGKAKIGSTLKGIGPTYMDKTGRNGIRVGDILAPNWEEKYQNLKSKHLNLLKSYPEGTEMSLAQLEKDFLEGVALLKTFQIIDSEQYMHSAQKEGKKILAEGAQGSLLDIDFGTYPFVTSSTTTAAGACTGLGIAPNQVKEVFGIFKAYATRVGSGPFPTELFDADGAKMAKVGNEFGATTGRPRRCGWIDLVALKYAITVNGATQLMMMKGDVLSGFKTIKVCTAYKTAYGTQDYLPYDLTDPSIEPIYTELPGWEEDLMSITDEKAFPKSFNHYIDFLEKELGTPIKIVSVGPDRKQTIFRG
ncbi:MAG: adenylosuccinate synthase [Flavobacteriaceae bacterium]